MNNELVYNTIKNLGFTVYPLFAPQNAKVPFIIYHEVNKSKAFSFTGRDTKVKSRFFVSSYAKTFKETQDMTLLLEAAIETISFAIYNIDNTKTEDNFRSRIDFSLYK